MKRTLFKAFAFGIGSKLNPLFNPTFCSGKARSIGLFLEALTRSRLLGAWRLEVGFNLGGTQVLENDLFPEAQMGACLYGATSIKCARMEAGSFLQNAELYEIVPSRPLRLWKLEEILKGLSDPSLLEIVKKAPMSKRWILQKVPLFSQLISVHLRSMGGDGIIFPSTKPPSESVIAFFVKDDAHAQMLFCSKAT